MQVFAQSTAQSNCNTIPNALSYLPSVNAAGSIENHFHKSSTTTGGLSLTTNASAATALLQIERHPTKDSLGSEFGADVTITGAVEFFVYGGNVGGATIGAGRTATAVAGNTDLLAVAFEAAGWNVTGDLSRSSSANPTAAPVLVDENHGGGLDVSYQFTQVSTIGSFVGIATTMAGFTGTAGSSGGLPAGTHALLWDYSNVVSFAVLDTEL